MPLPSPIHLLAVVVCLLYVVVSLALTAAYVAVMEWYRRGWEATPLYTAPPLATYTTLVSVLLPVRNEAEHLATTVDALLAQTYPAELYEIIILDDFSDDATPTIAHHYAQTYPQSVKVIHLSEVIDDEANSFKKKAITAGIAAARGSESQRGNAECRHGTEPHLAQEIIVQHEK